MRVVEHNVVRALAADTDGVALQTLFARRAPVNSDLEYAPGVDRLPPTVRCLKAGGA